MSLAQFLSSLDTLEADASAELRAVQNAAQLEKLVFATWVQKAVH